MATVQNFEDLEVWKEGRILSKKVYGLTAQGDFARDYGLKDQIRRAAVSIMSNIAEGFERSRNNELRHFLILARGSAGELRSQLYVALDANFITQSQFSELHERSSRIARLLTNFITYLERKSKEEGAPTAIHRKRPQS